MIKYLKKAVSMLTAAVMMMPAGLTSLAVSTTPTEAASAYLKKGKNIYYSSVGAGSGWSTHEYEATINGQKGTAYCGQADQHAPHSGTYEAFGVSLSTLTAKVMYFSDDYFKEKEPTKGKNWRYVITHLAVCKAASQEGLHGSGLTTGSPTSAAKASRDALIAYARGKNIPHAKDQADVWWQREGKRVTVVDEMADADSYFKECTNYGDPQYDWKSTTRFSKAVSFRNSNSDVNFKLKLPPELAAVVLTNNNGKHTLIASHGYGTDLTFNGKDSGDYLIIFRCAKESVTTATVTLEGSAVPTGLRAYTMKTGRQRMFALVKDTDKDTASLKVNFNTKTDYEISKSSKSDRAIKGTKFEISENPDMNPIKDTQTVHYVKVANDDDDATATFKGLDIGKTYYVREAYVPKPYKRSTKIVKIKPTSGENSYNFVDARQTGSVKAIKKDAETGQTVEGATFHIVNNAAVWNANDKRVKKGKFSKDFTSTLNNVPLGEYTVTEVKAPAGYNINKKPQTITVKYNKKLAQENKNAKTLEFTMKDPHKGYVAVKKSSADCAEYVDPEASSNAAYTLKGAVYGVYSDEGCTKKLFEMTTDKDGFAGSTDANADLLDSGTTYYIKEITPANKGHTLDPTVHSMKAVRSKEDAKAKAAPSKEEGIGDPLKAFVDKIDTESGRASPQGNGSLAGAQFTLTYYNKYYGKNEIPSSHTKQWVFKTDESGVSKFEENYKVSGDEMPKLGMFPLGTYTLTESSAPTGYKLDGSKIVDSSGIEVGASQKYYFQIKQNGDTRRSAERLNERGEKITTITAYNATDPALSVAKEQIQRGTVKIEKNNADVPQDTMSVTPDGDATLAGAQYQLINRSKNPVLVDTNGNGKFDWNDANKNGILDDGEDTATDEWYKPGEVITTLTTDKDGKASMPANSLPYGSYEIKEIKSPEGYLLDAIRGAITDHTFDITKDHQLENYEWKNEYEEKNDFTHSFYNASPRGQIKIKKNNADVHNDDPDAAKAQGDSTFEGAQFQIINKSKSYVWVDTNHNGKYDWNDANKNGKFEANEDTKNDERYAPGEVICTLTTDKNGFASTPEKFLPYGTYTVKEVKAPAGYLLTENGFRGAITEQDNITIRTEGQVQNFEYKNEHQAQGDYEHTFYNAPPRGTFKFKKRDAETKKDKPLGGASFDGTYRLINRSKSYVWVNLDGSKDAKGNPTYDKSEKFEPGATIFKFVTDKHTGYFDTYTDLKDGEKVMRADGTPLDKSKLGRLLLPYGTYEIYEEVPPTGYLHTPKVSTQFSIRNKDSSGKEVQDKDVNEILDMTDDEFHKDPNAKDQSGAQEKNAIYNYVKRGDIYFDKKTFNARDSDDSADTNTPSPSKKESYIPFRITSLDQDGKAVESHIVFTDINGVYDSRASYAQHTYHTNAGDNGYNAKTQKVTNDDNSKGHVGTWFGIDQGAPVKDRIPDRADENKNVYDTLGAFPYGRYKIDELRCDKNKGANLFHGSFSVEHEASTNITEYTDPSDWANGGKLHDNPDLGTIYDRYVTISTEALEREHSTHSAAVSDDVDVIDSVEMNNLLQDNKYRLTASMVYSDTGAAVKNPDGTELKFVKDFSAVNEFTTIKVPMNLDAEALGLGGRTVTVYEKLEVKLTDGSYEDVTSEEDKLSEDQQITFPDVGTKATAGNGQQLEEAKKDATIIDTVAYKNFTPGKSYRMETYLVDKGTGKYITVDGDKMAAQTTFKPAKADGTQDVKITFDATGLEGKSLVVFEKVYRNDTLYAQHTDIDDEGQTIRFPAVHTTATDKETEDHIGSDGKAQIVDEVAYSNVIAGKEYTIKGRLVSKSDPTKVIAEAESTFTPEGTEGTVNVTFDDVDLTQYDGETLVAYEKLYIGDYEIATHENPEDEGQSVHKPKVGTTAKDKATDDHIASHDEKATFIDTVQYSNVLPGKEYTVKGELYNKETGESLGVTAEKTFTPDTADGTVDLEFTIDATKLAGTTVVAFEDLNYKGIKVAAHADLKDENQSVHVPDIHTTAVDKASDDKNTKYGTDTVITDTVAYNNLVPGKEYKVKGELYNKETGKSIGVTAEKTFTPEEADGSVDIEFTVDTTKLQGQTLVAFETMTYKDIEVAVHADINDVDQTVYVPEVHTTALSETTDSHTAAYSKTEKIKDAVEYKNLIVGREYTIKGELYDKKTGKSIGVKAERTFTAEATDGTVDLEFTVDSTKLAGTTVVAFETLEHKGVSIGVHADINDVDQSVNVPGIKTSAVDKTSGTKTVTYGKKVKVTDTVAYTQLTSGKEYTVSGELYSKKTGKSIGAKAEKKFTPEKADGTVTLEFTVDSTELEGQTLVAFENLYEKKVLVGIHANINDKEQTVYVPQLHTTATDRKTGTKTVSYGSKTVINDAVKYSNLTVGKTYTVKGELYNRDSGKSIGAKAQKTFTAKASSGTVVLSFTVDSTKLAGATVVAFEKLYTKGIEVAAHADLEDEDQSVYVPSIRTSATIGGDKSSDASSHLTVDDNVILRNLVVGRKYTVKGELHDKATGKALSINGRKITAEKTFTANAKRGYINLHFTFDARACGGRSIVVFEKLYTKDILVGNHADINDRSQTVYVNPVAPAPKPARPSKPSPGAPKKTKTGDTTEILPYIEIAVTAFMLAIAIIIRRRISRNH